MSEDFSAKTCLVYDHGFFLPVARRLARDFGRVLYYTPWERAYPTLNEGVIGAGFDLVIRCNNFWPLLNQIDLFVFPDIYEAGLQAHLRSLGHRVWGAGAGMKLEMDREFFMRKLAELGLDVAPHQAVTGLSNLAAYLKDKQDQYIKVSKWRGSWETQHWRSWEEDADRLDTWAVKLGGLKEHVPFLVFEQIDTELEIGADTFCVHGRWPSVMLHGIEAKDEAYFAAVTPRNKMPDALVHIMDAFSPFLAETGFASQWSMEVRVTETENYFIDATARGGLPSTGSFLEARNVADIFYHGANGDLVEPEYGFNFAAEAMVKIKSDPNAWGSIVIPDELNDRLKVYDACQLDGKVMFPSDNGKPIDEIGWLVATGDTPTATLKTMNELADQLPSGAEAAVEGLAGILRQIEAEQDAGIDFTDQPVPAPAVVLEPA